VLLKSQNGHCNENTSDLLIAFPDARLPEQTSFKKLVSPFALFQSYHTY
jgi:hypothetical protein